MIKRIRFATRHPNVGPEAFRETWPRAVAVSAGAPADVRPARVTVCTTLPELSGPAPRHDGIGFECFADAAHLERFEAWLRTPEGSSLSASAGQVVDERHSPLIVAEERVLRGADWLEQRWHDGGAKLKHLAIARRAAHLSAAEFSERWGDHAGQVGGAGGAAVARIPDDARGLAYCQDHPCPRPGGDWAYDALNEVWFDDLDGLRTRVEWFRENLGERPADDLFRRSWFLAAREDVVLA